MSNMYGIFSKLLKEKDVRAADVSRATGISSTVFSEWKKGKSTPKQDKLQKIADYFGVSIEYLLTGEVDLYYQEMCDDPDMRSLFEMKKEMKSEQFAAHIELLKKLHNVSLDQIKQITDSLDSNKIELEKFAQIHQASDLEQEIIMAYLELDPKIRKIFIDHFKHKFSPTPDDHLDDFPDTPEEFELQYPPIIEDGTEAV
ncbi:helix-turn-helix domain-containing protein [Cuneatibacter caecimuris]|uniref:Cro/C1-type helix-turn-helix DNA-binding protein n=1 Tax=Cuneatibacter caecimuris TaxID=1796618 RepID=A0A4Q7PKI8_9FIRM|nr:helix-turn-helix transcriptional regulator [Cuneatibacter caecimuris]RZT01206.1 Cro/C1-type helix-turn-helix DNA-binding protein [Cuneatibacter caecimuris]